MFWNNNKNNRTCTHSDNAVITIPKNNKYRPCLHQGIIQEVRSLEYLPFYAVFFPPFVCTSSPLLQTPYLLNPTAVLQAGFINFPKKIIFANFANTIYSSEHLSAQKFPEKVNSCYFCTCAVILLRNVSIRRLSPPSSQSRVNALVELPKKNYVKIWHLNFNVVQWYSFFPKSSH